ncbi:MAG: ROK family protein [Deltaproteobacteria bacterium]|nr:ROK family protein [Deltaproteobacteria bacterium]MBW2051981.1 ROK family protein [Deltaproteobacteria bacterium]MBW2141064.1 ROK family protein [Deltaproteobacteria bacterium]MBW2323122.1 ROK family protein [Deltaproteobacteria bacterium]
MNYLSVDIGGTKVRYGLVSAEGKVLSSSHFLIHSERGFDLVIEDMAAQFNRFLEAIPEPDQPGGAAVGVAGRVSPREGVVIYSPNLPGWNNVPLAVRLQEALGFEVRIENDSNLYALGEWLGGAGQGLENLVVITLGTGVGGGLILNNRLWTGSFENAAEVGHMVVEPDGRLCKCGSRGCLETLASGTAMADLAREWIQNGEPCGYQGKLEYLTSADLFDLARQGDTLALKVFDKAGSSLGLALTNVFNLLGLQGAIIGGGAGVAFDLLKPKITEELSARLFTADPDKILLARSELGDNAPLVGAPTLFQTK